MTPSRPERMTTRLQIAATAAAASLAIGAIAWATVFSPLTASSATLALTEEVSHLTNPSENSTSSIQMTVAETGVVIDHCPN